MGGHWRQAPINMPRFNIHFVFLLVFFFPCANLCGTERAKTNSNTHESIIAVIQWLSMNSKYVCHSFSELGWQGLQGRFEVQHCHLWAGSDAAGFEQITSSYWQRWCVFLSDAVAQTKRSRDIVVHREDKGALRSSAHADVLRKGQFKTFKVFFPP